MPLAKSGPSDACAAEALDRRLDAWTCLGNTLTFFEDTGDGVAQRSELVHSSSTDTTTRIAPAEPLAAASSGNNTWCESGPSVCRTVMNAYQAKVKGNVIWGNSNGVNGSFDLVMSTNLNGRQSRVTSEIFRDSGANLSFRNLLVECNHDGNSFGCGAFYADNQDGKVYVSGSWRGPTVYGNKLTQRGTYNDRLPSLSSWL